VSAERAELVVTGPQTEYRSRLDARTLLHESRVRMGKRIADARLGVFLLAVLVLSVALAGGRLSWAWCLIPLGVFVALVVAYDRVSRTTRRAARGVAYYEAGLRRLEGTWAGTGVGGQTFLDPEHLYAADLDVFGPGSLFERLCTARTRAGEERLASWLLRAADPATIRERNEAIVELRPKLDLRETIALLGADVREGVDPDAIATWGAAPAVYRSRLPVWVARGLAVLGLASIVAWATTSAGMLPLLVVAMAELVFWATQRARIARILGSVERRSHDLVVTAALLERLESEACESALLRRLRSALETQHEPASRRVARLARWVGMIDWGANQFFAPFAALVLWKTQLAFAVEAWRVGTGPEIAGWLDAVGEFEALESLAAYAYENPADPFPEIVEGDTVYEGESLGHPLIPEGSCVRNDVRLGGEVRVLLVSGSNMSGKSTLLRTVGANAVLAFAGAPVRAGRLKLSVLALGATLRVQDSLQAGRSRFYAELTRIRALVETAEGPRPLLFLLDEIFHGTNSHDRSVGAEAVIRGLIGRGAVGIVTTHDLALAAAAERLAPQAFNVHFEDQLIDGTLHFDYRMRPGIVTHSNALALMRAVGLDV
jgi:hypothetical protein